MILSMSNATHLVDVFSNQAITLIRSAKRFSSDSRKIDSETLFIALKGSATDGHNYINDEMVYLAKGIVASLEWARSQNGLRFRDHPKFIFVESTHQAHRSLAKYFRSQFLGKIIGVGGSAGKTTTKEFLYALLSSKFKCFKTEKSQNGELGIPKTLEQLNDKLQIGIIEIGIDAPGDMERHWEIVKPDIAVLVSIGEEHLNLLKTVDNVFQEEKILFDKTLKDGGIAFAPETDGYLKSYRNTKGVTLTSTQNSPTWGLQDLPSEIQVQNACLAAEVARHLGMSDSEIKNLSTSLGPTEGRGVITSINDNIIVEDHYNSNPSSLALAVKQFQTLSAKNPFHKKVLVIGDMLDLGEHSQASHQKLATVLSHIKADAYFLVGKEFPSMKKSFETYCPAVFAEEDSIKIQKPLGDFLRNVGSPVLVLFKGSRGIKLEACLMFTKNLLLKF
jgi:UDP-N-acetylmuramoyl-tripeptide--D-alanyl-D-alanine ligase